MEEQLRRFRAGLDTVTTLSGGASSLEAVVSRLVTNLARADTASLIRLTISRGEFAWLTFPDSPLGSEPYQQSPDITWLMHAAGSGSGLGRLLNRFGGAHLMMKRWRCTDPPAVEGLNRLWKDCDVTFTVDGATQTLRLFSGIIERDGHFKILSYANAF